MAKIPASERDAFYEVRRGEIADAALRLWAEQGFDQTSVAAIARAAGISKGTFYLYFESKEVLLEEVFRRNSLVPRVQELIQDLQRGSLEDAVRRFVRGAWRHLVEHRDVVLLALRELPTHLSEVHRLVERLLVPANRLLAGFLAARVPAGRAEQISLVISARSLLGMVLFAFLTQEVLGVGRFLPASEEEVTATVAELFLHGLSGPSPGGGEAC